MKLVGEPSTGVAAIKQLRPDIILMDLPRPEILCAEAFNLANDTRLANPGTVMRTSAFGVITQVGPATKITRG